MARGFRLHDARIGDNGESALDKKSVLQAVREAGRGNDCPYLRYTKSG